jgi:DNA-binding response OmpR family regulator
MALQLLLIERKDLPQSESLLANLKNKGYQVAVVHNLELAIETTKTLWPNLIVISPTNGQQMLTRFQELICNNDLDIPCILVSHDPHLPNEVDCVVAQVAPDRLETLPEKIESAMSSQKNRFIRLPNLVIDCQQRQVLRDKEHFSLTPKEYKLLYLLIKKHGQILSRKEIMQTVWETDYMGDTRTLDVHIRWIREKIEEDPSKPQRLVTVRGVGYCFILHP